MIGERAEIVRRVLASKGLPAAALGPIGEIERWIDDILPDLRRRHQIASAAARLPLWSPTAGTLVPYQEKDITSPAESLRLGRQLAETYKSIDPDGPFATDLREKHEKIVEALTAHVHDPEFAAAFFAGIGPRGTLDLPRRLRRSLKKDEAEEAVETVSRAFGSAVGGGTAVPGFAAVTRAMRVRSGEDEDRRAIGDLLSAGRFPTEWLAEVVALHAFSGYGKPAGDALAPYLNALGNNPEAARLAIALSTHDSLLPKDRTKLLSYSMIDLGPSTTTFLRELNGRAAVDASSADAFGRMLAAASGAYDEKDGAHSEVAARFAFTVITATAGFPFGPATRVHLSEIAGSYATEMTEGANIRDENHLLPSSFQPVPSRIPGLKSVFRLSPEDTFRFITTFAGSESDRLPFESSMGDLTRRLVNVALPATLKDKDLTRLDDVFRALGNVRGFELGAAYKLHKPIDDTADAARKSWSLLIGTGLGMAGLAVPGLAGAIVWTGLSTGWSFYDTLKEEPGQEADKDQAKDDQETLGRQYTIAQLLMDAGFPTKVSPKDYQATLPSGIEIVDDNGNFRPFHEIFALGEKGLRTLDQWYLENGMGGDEKYALGEVSGRWAEAFDGRKQTSQWRGVGFKP
jgi:hypothetical protein